MANYSIVPTTHILKSKRARTWTLAGALAELVDNSLGHGKANNVMIEVDNTLGVVLADDGIGIDDVGRIFKLGDSSVADTKMNIGQFGVGATDATIWLGQKVSVRAVRDGRKQMMSADWRAVEATGDWTLNKPAGKPSNEPTGTMIMIEDLNHTFHAVTMQTVVTELGRIFAPALRSGKKIEIQRYLANAKEPVVIPVVPFTPSDLTDDVVISGVVETKAGPLAWSGRAGLSETLGARNGVHVAWGYRVIEVTRDPFGVDSAPTLYAEVNLGEEWRTMLSDHKDRVVLHREALITSIGEVLAPLLAKSAKQATYLALQGLTAPIEQAVKRALKGLGILHADCDDPQSGGHGTTDIKIEAGDRRQDVPQSDDGCQAKEAKSKPTGVSVDWLSSTEMCGKLYDWEIRGKTFMLILDGEKHANTTGWPLKLRDAHVVQLVLSYLSQALTVECMKGDGLGTLLNLKLRDQLTEWTQNGQSERIAPLLNSALLSSIKK